jgi:hypothetical protein
VQRVDRAELGKTGSRVVPVGVVEASQPVVSRMRPVGRRASIALFFASTTRPGGGGCRPSRTLAHSPVVKEPPHFIHLILNMDFQRVASTPVTPIRIA